MKVLLIGGYGLLGSDIFTSFNNAGHQVLRYSKEELNLLDSVVLKKRIQELQPDLVIHAAGYTDVTAAEDDFEAVVRVNCFGTYNLVRAIQGIETTVVYISTDYVFSGDKNSPYTEKDEPCPVNNYGWSKLMSEDIIRANCAQHYIIRTSWLFGQNGNCFPKKFAYSLNRNKRSSVVDDQFGSPTYTVDLANSLLTLDELPFGIYHLTNSGVTNWYQFALLIAEYLGWENSDIIPASSSEFGSKVERPLYSALSNEKWDQYRARMRPYHSALKEFLLSTKI